MSALKQQLVKDDTLAKLYQVERSKELPQIPFELWQQRALEIIQTVCTDTFGNHAGTTALSPMLDDHTTIATLWTERMKFMCQ